MLDPVVDLVRQVLRISALEQRVLAQRELGRGGHVALGNHRHQSAGERLHAGDGLNLHIRCMHVQVAHVDQVHQIFLGIEPEDGWIRQLLRHATVLRFLRTVTGQNELDVLRVLRQQAGLDEHVLALLLGQSSHHQDAELALQLRDLGDVLVLEALADAVGDHVALPLVMVLLQLIGNKLTRAVDVVHLLVEELAKCPIKEIGHEAATTHSQVVGDILRLAVEGGGARNAALLRQLCDAP